MRPRLLPISEQVAVIAGASSGIGLVTAKEMAARGTRVVLAARNARALQDAVDAIRARGGRAMAVTADVSDLGQVEQLAETAVREFGRIDTWVNNAAVALYGRITQLPIDDMRRQMDINYWGQVHGSIIAVRHLRGRGGAIVNVGSGLSDRAIPLQATYCAAKHALKAFTDALRMELEEEGVPISVTLVKPASIDTPFYDKARTYLGVEPRPVSPVYAPEVVCAVILEAAQRPLREVTAGGAGAKLAAARLLPRVADRYMEQRLFDAQKTEKPAGGRPDNLYASVDRDGGERSANWTGHTRRSSLYTRAALNRGATAGVVVGLAAAIALGLAARRA